MSVMNLKSYFGKKVKIVCTDEEILVGFVEGVDEASSNDNGMESLDLSGTKYGKLVDINEEEIKSIEVIE